MSAIASRPARIRETYESAFTRPLPVDRERGVIPGVKVLGWKSKNRREYLKEAAQKAVTDGLYEGVPVYFNHQAGTGDRDALAKLGRIRAPQVRDDGVYGELHYNRKHPMAEAVVEDAERGLGIYHLSHDADKGKYELRDGIEVIQEIARVYSVDIVGEGATVSSLSESTTTTEAPKRIQVSALLEQLAANPKLPKRIRRRLLEQDGEDMTADVPAPPPDADPMTQLAQAAAALAASGDPDQHELGMKILKMLKPEAPPTGDVGGGGGGDGGGDGGGPSESRRRQRSEPERLTESVCRDLCEAAGVEPDAELLGLMASTGTIGAAAKVMRRAAGKVREGSVPRSSSGVVVQESAGKVPDDPAQLARWLRG